MKLIRCPDQLVDKKINEHAVFMAGGITGCPNWQDEVAFRYRSANVTLINPRRPDWNVMDGSDEFQIEWEFRHLNMADEIYFWFPKEGKCMITLFELGTALGEKRKIRVGVEPGYIRELDVREQVKHRAPWLTVYSTLEELYAPLA